MRPDLPAGTVTFLFTDVEGSTRLLDEVGAERYAALLAEHHGVCRAAWEAHGGVEVDTAGDAFFVAFARPSDALTAAAEAQRALGATGLRVRMGVHTGEVTVAETGYVGLEVHRAARIAAAAHGGQVLVSAATAALVDEPLTDLGEHRFKDLRAPERVFQVGGVEFPPIRSLHRSNLPVPATAFLGRERELGEVVALLRDGGARVVTLTGPGGTGKTRLALQAAAESSDAFPAGVWWVALAPLLDPRLVLPAAAAAVGVEVDDERAVLDALVERFDGHHALVLLDNAEHLLPTLASELARLVGRAPTLRLLVTSRERLQIAGETSYPVPEMEHADAVELFVARARAAGVVVPASEAVERLCDRLERLPLALELAASRTPLLAPEQLLDRLGRRLDLLKGGRDADPRQATLRATIDWSYDLLDEEEQRVFRGLAVFVGGCTFEAAEEVLVADLDVLQSLLDKSLIRRRAGHSGERLWMLETVREYATERLGQAQGEGHRVRSAHAAWAHALAKRAESEITGPAQLDWLAVLDDEIDNLRAGFDALVESGDADAAVRVPLGLWFYASWRSQRIENLAMFERSLSLPGMDPALRAKALTWWAWPIDSLTPGEARLAALDEALSLAEQLGDPQRTGAALEARAFVAGLSPDEQIDALERARALFEELFDLTRVTGNLGATLAEHGRFAEALPVLEEAAALARRMGDRNFEAIALANAAEALLHLCEPSRAAARLHEAIAIYEEMGDERGLGVSLAGAAEVALTAGDLRSAALLLGVHDRAVPREMRDPISERSLSSLRAAVAAGLGDGTTRALAEGAELDVPEGLALARTVLERVAADADGSSLVENLDSPNTSGRP